MSSAPIGTLRVRHNPSNPNHHLYRNNRGYWWAHYVLHLPDYTATRVRRSLGTADVGEARRRRDAIFAAFAETEVAS